LFCDVFVCSCLDEKKKRIRIKPLDNGPVGTIFKLDLRLAYGKKGKPYFKARAGRPMGRAIEYFEQILALQKNVVRE
jgi:hypothetical protein